MRDIPDVHNFLNAKSGGSIFSESGLSNKNGQVVMNQDEILMIADTLGNKNYSFQFLSTEAPPFTFYNLIIPVSPDGVKQEPYVMSFTSEAETLDTFLQDPDSDGIDFANFTGKVNIHPFEYFFPDGSYSKNECTGHDEFGDPILCEQIFVDSGATGSGGNGGGNGGPNNPPWDPYTGWSGTRIYHITPAANNYQVYQFSGGSTCAWPGQCIIVHVYDGGSSASQKSSDLDDCAGCEVIASGGTAVNTTPSLYAGILNTKLDNILNTYQLSFLSSNSSMTQQMRDFLNGNDNDEAKRFVYLAIQGIMEGAFSSFNSILVSDRNYLDHNEVLTPFPLLKYPPNLAQQYETQYPKLTEYLKNQMPKVANITKIVDAINEFTTIPIEDIKRDLQWGEGPIIEVVQLDTYRPGYTDEDTVGFFDDEIPDRVFLDIDYLNDLELRTTDQTVEDELLFFLGTTILHEYVHYGDYSQGFDYRGEEGREFEVKVYGFNVGPDTARLALDRINN